MHSPKFGDGGAFGSSSTGYGATPTSSSGSSGFGSSATGFGATQTASAVASGGFGSTALAATPASSTGGTFGFGSPTNQSSTGFGFLSGLGDKPSAENVNKNVFGGGPSFGSTTNTAGMSTLKYFVPSLSFSQISVSNIFFRMQVYLEISRRRPVGSASIQACSPTLAHSLRLKVASLKLDSVVSVFKAPHNDSKVGAIFTPIYNSASV